MSGCHPGQHSNREEGSPDTTTGRERETRLGLESGSEGGMLLCELGKSVVSVVAARGAGVRLAGPADWS